MAAGKHSSRNTRQIDNASKGLISIRTEARVILDLLFFQFLNLGFQIPGGFRQLLDAHLGIVREHLFNGCFHRISGHLPEMTQARNWRSCTVSSAQVVRTDAVLLKSTVFSRRATAGRVIRSLAHVGSVHASHRWASARPLTRGLAGDRRALGGEVGKRLIGLAAGTGRSCRRIGSHGAAHGLGNAASDGSRRGLRHRAYRTTAARHGSGRLRGIHAAHRTHGTSGCAACGRCGGFGEVAHAAANAVATTHGFAHRTTHGIVAARLHSVVVRVSRLLLRTDGVGQGFRRREVGVCCNTLHAARACGSTLLRRHAGEGLDGERILRLGEVVPSNAAHDGTARRLSRRGRHANASHADAGCSHRASDDAAHDAFTTSAQLTDVTVDHADEEFGNLRTGDLEGKGDQEEDQGVLRWNAAGRAFGCSAEVELELEVQGKARRQPWWLAYGEKGCASGTGLSSARPPLNFSALARVQAKMFVFAFLTSLTRKN